MSPMYAFTKQVSEDDTPISQQQILDQGDIANIKKVINDLEIMQAVESSNLDSLELSKSYRRHWVEKLLLNSSLSFSSDEIVYLLSDFTEHMQTRMKEVNKYALALLSDNRVVLCHSNWGEDTITPEWKTIRRMLDTGNVLRFISFFYEKEAIKVRYWERYRSLSFSEWLGFHSKGGALHAGEYSVRFQIDGVMAEIQISDDQIDDWLKKHPEITDRQFISLPDVKLVGVDSIGKGNRSFKDVRDFLEFHRAEFRRYRDEKDCVSKFENEQWVPVFGKMAATKTPVDVLFTDEKIDISETYLRDLTARILNNESVNLFHAGCKFEPVDPVKVGNVQIYNSIQCDQLAKSLFLLYNETDLQDRSLAMSIMFAAFTIIGRQNESLPLSPAMSRISEEIARLIMPKGKWIKNEEVIEYKSSDFMAGGHDEVVARFEEDLKKKLQKDSFKLYFVGVEDNGQIHGVAASRLSSERVRALEKAFRKLAFVRDCYVFTIGQAEQLVMIIVTGNTS
jgi:hypothetical protein